MMSHTTNSKGLNEMKELTNNNSDDGKSSGLHHKVLETRMLNEDVLLEISSRCSATEIAKFRLLNKDYNKRSYELSFFCHHIHRTNAVFGYFVQEPWFKHCRSYFVSGLKEEESQISIGYIPSYNAMIRACDTHHGILLCVDDKKYKGRQIIPDYIVCKPATKEYRIIPNPKTRYFTEAIGLMVMSLSPFRYKIIRVSQPDKWVTKEGLSRYKCEVFDSDLFKWKRLNDLLLPGFFPNIRKPVSTYGCLHWLTYDKNNVIRFCMRTETWSIFQVPNEPLVDHSLVSYEGKLGMIRSKEKEGTDLWVLEKSSGKSWIKVKDAKIRALKECVQPLWFLSNDAVSMAGSSRLGLYNMNNNSCQYLQTNKSFTRFDSPSDYFTPFYSNYDMVGLNKR